MIVVIEDLEQDGGEYLGANSSQVIEVEVVGVGPQGPQGVQGIPGPQGDQGPQGIPGAKGDQGDQGPQGVPGVDGVDGVDGDDGREVELQKSATHVQWRYVGDVDWIDLVPLADLKGDQGVQGPSGADGAPGADGQDGASAYEVAVAQGFVGTEPEWLASLVGPAGADGADGTNGVDGVDGREVELQKSATHVQWRYVGDPGWTDIVALADITGPQGEQGPQGLQGEQGLPGADGVGVPAGGTTGQVLAKASSADHDTGWVEQSGGGGSGTVESVVPGTGIDVDSTDPSNPVVSMEANLALYGKGFVNHGAVAGTVRPTGFASVEWYGTVEPTNAIDGDTWNNPS